MTDISSGSYSFEELCTMILFIIKHGNKVLVVQTNCKHCTFVAWRATALHGRDEAVSGIHLLRLEALSAKEELIATWLPKRSAFLARIRTVSASAGIEYVYVEEL